MGSKIYKESPTRRRFRLARARVEIRERAVDQYIRERRGLKANFGAIDRAEQ